MFSKRFCPLPYAISFYLIVFLGSLSGCSEGKHVAQLSDSEKIEEGVEYLRVFNFDSAYSTLSDVQPELEVSDPNWPLATYSLGLAAWHKTPPENESLIEARTLLKLVAERAHDSIFAASALLDLGRMAEVSDFRGDPPDVAKAQSYYREVMDRFPVTEMSTRATLFLAQTLAQSFENESVREAIILLNDEIESQPDSKWKGTLAQYVAQLYAFYLHDSRSALIPYETAMRAGFPRSAESDVSLWQFGLLAQEAGNDLLAAEVFNRIVVEYPRSIYGTVARSRIIEISKKYPEEGIVIPELSTVGLGR